MEGQIRRPDINAVTGAGPKGPAFFYGGKMAHKVVVIKLQGKRYRIKQVSLNEFPAVASGVLGGRGLNSAILWSLRRYLPTDWKSSRNAIVIGAGPFAGSKFPSTGRTTISVLKSPVTGMFSDGNFGGYFGAALRRSGIAAIVLIGKLRKPHIIHINVEGFVSLKQISNEAFHNYGTLATEGYIESKYCDRKYKAVTMSIGPAGAAKTFCAIPISKNRAAGGGGTGAVLGVKKIKAITIEYDDRDSMSFVLEDDKVSFEEVSKEAEEKIKSHPVFDMFSTYGTTSLIEIHAGLDYLPVNNWEQSCDPKWPQVSGKELEARTKKEDPNYKEREEQLKDADNFGCSNCPITCSNLGKIEYETLNCLGPKLGIYDLNFIQTCNMVTMNDQGLDVIQATSVLAALMNMSHDGVLKHPIKWGDANYADDFFLELCKPRKDGRTLASHFHDGGFYKGILRLLTQYSSNVINWDRFLYMINEEPTMLGRYREAKGNEAKAALLTDYYYVHSKGYGLSGVYINRHNKGVALAAATSTRGADHLRSLPTLATYADWYLGGGGDTKWWKKLWSMMKIPLRALWLMKAESKNLFGDLYLTYQKTFGVPEPITRKWQESGFLHNKDQLEGWALMVKFCQEMYAVSDSLGTCKFTSTWRFGVGPELIAKALNIISDSDWTWERVLKCGETVTAIERRLKYQYRNRPELTDDDIPQKFYSKVVKDRLSRIEMSEILADYYKTCGYHEFGVDTRKWRELVSSDMEKEFKLLEKLIALRR